MAVAPTILISNPYQHGRPLIASGNRPQRFMLYDRWLPECVKYVEVVRRAEDYRDRVRWVNRNGERGEMPIDEYNLDESLDAIVAAMRLTG